MSDQNLLYPQLSEEAEKEAVKITNQFIDKLKILVNEALDKFYVEELPYIESDSWSNFRNQIMDGFMDYNNGKIQAKYDFKRIKHEIFEAFHDEIIKDLNQDILDENEELDQEIGRLRNIIKSLQST
jgi:uncharacterized coiled-coil protein SlyX